MATALFTPREIQTAVWSVLRWVVGVGAALAFAAGAWAMETRKDLDTALHGSRTANSVVVTVEKQLDSLRIEMRHVSRNQEEILRILRDRPYGQVFPD
jgi:hypothetical protein